MTHSEIVKAVTSLFSEMEEKNVRYAILRKVELIPDNIGNDIDILIDKREKPLVLTIIHECAKEFGFKVYERKDVKGLYAILYKFINGELIFYRLDFADCIKNSNELLDKRIKNEKGLFYLPSGIYEKKKNYNLKRFFTFPKRFLFPTGKFIVILGPDGVGKSTTADLIRQIFEAFHIPVTHMHLGFRPSILPTKKSLMSFGKESISAPGEKSKVPGLIRFFYHSMDYVLGYFFRIRPLLVKGRMIIGERYYYSYLVDPRKQNELGFPLWLPRFVFNLFIPKPDVVVLLSHSDASEVFKRRQEHSIQEIERQFLKYRELGEKTKKFLEVKTDKSLEYVAEEIVKQLIRK